MKKILSVSQCREADTYTIAKEPVLSLDLMERAALSCFHWIKANYSKDNRFLIFCGTGNNGGDGLALARILYQDGFEVIPYIIRSSAVSSADCHYNEARLLQLDLSLVRNVTTLDDIAPVEKESIIVDAIFGIGLNKSLTGLPADVVDLINNSGSAVIALDMPSGLFADHAAEFKSQVTIKATVTLTFQTMKLAFLMQENAAFTGKVIVLDIGISKDFILNVATPYFLVEKEDVKKIAAPRNLFAHKGTYGHALIISGSMGKSGAAILAGRGCLRSGVGLLTLHVPKSVFKLMPVAVPEAMYSGDSDWDCFTDSISTEKYDAIGVGCGIGTSSDTAKALKLLIQGYRNATVFDADAINILAANKTWMDFISPESIFTPHPREFERLVGKSTNQFERLQMQIDFAKRYHIYLLVKGRFTSIACPDGTCYFNTTGNPGMATAGSGDVLAGIITGLLAQGFSSKEACIGGVYLHGLAGDFASFKETQQSMIASDIIACMGDAFRELASED